MLTVQHNGALRNVTESHAEKNIKVEEVDRRAK